MLFFFAEKVVKIILFVEFEHERLENSKWKSGIEGKLDLILSLLKYPNAAPGEESQSLMEEVNPFIEKQKVQILSGK